MPDLYNKPLVEGITQLDGGQIHRFASRQLPRNIVLCPAVAKAVREFKPDMTYLNCVNTFFGSELLSDRSLLSGALFISFAEHSNQHRSIHPWPIPWLKKAILNTAFFLIKRPLSRKGIEVSDAALCITPDTADFILKRISYGRKREELRKKCVLFPLGFDSNIFYPSEKARQLQRQQLGIADDEIVGLHSGQITRYKKLDVWVSSMVAGMRKVKKLKAMLIGMHHGDAESDRIQAMIEQSGFKERFICLPFSSQEKLATLYNAADFGVWFWSASVSIQQAMGVGLYMLLYNAPVVSHLVTTKLGHYFEEGNFSQLEELIIKTAEAFAKDPELSSQRIRSERAEINRRRFSYDALAKRLVTAAEDPVNAAAHLSFPEK
jgi:glycosyltransferase involved in cell wall biosynthesis